MSSPTSLRSRSDIGRVFKEGKRFRARDVTLICLPVSDRNARFAISVRRGLGAVKRNRVRRRVKEALRSAGPLEGGYGIVVAERSIQNLPFDELQRQMCQILEAAGLIRAR